jgi:hypothetical protein
VLQCSVGLSNKVSNVIRRHTDNMKLLLVLSHSFIFNVHIYIYIHIHIYRVSQEERT